MTPWYSRGTCFVSASRVSYMWLSASKTSKSSVRDGTAHERTGFLTLASIYGGAGGHLVEQLPGAVGQGRPVEGGPALGQRRPGAGERVVVEGVERGGEVGGRVSVGDAGAAERLVQVGPRGDEGGDAGADGVGHLPRGEVGAPVQRQGQDVDGGQAAVVDGPRHLLVGQGGDAGVIGQALAGVAQHEELQLIAPAGGEPVDEQLRVLAGAGRPHETDAQVAGCQAELGLGGLAGTGALGADGVTGAGRRRHQRAPVAVGDHAVQGVVPEGVAGGHGVAARLAVVDHAGGDLGPGPVELGVVGGGVRGQVVLRPDDGHAGLGHGGGRPGVSSTWWTARSSPFTLRHSASPSTSTVVTRRTGSPAAVTRSGWAAVSGTRTASAPGGRSKVRSSSTPSVRPSTR